MAATWYAVFRRDGTARIAKRPRLANDEVGIRLTVTWPDGWGRISGDVEVAMPQPPSIDVDAEPV